MRIRMLLTYYRSQRRRKDCRSLGNKIANPQATGSIHGREELASVHEAAKKGIIKSSSFQKVKQRAYGIRAVLMYQPLI